MAQKEGAERQGKEQIRKVLTVAGERMEGTMMLRFQQS